MNQITHLTKQDIFDIIFKGYQVHDDFLEQTYHYGINYHGRLEIPEFLSRLYNLKDLPSLDERYADAETDIHVHTVVNDDYPIDFILEDERFKLKEADDETLLKFICEIFHPEVRIENISWIEIKNKLSILLSADGYEIIPIDEISGREVYGWRFVGNLFKPFSLRFEHQINRKEIQFSLSIKTRKQIFNAFSTFDENVTETDETGWNYNYWLSDKVLDNIKEYYEPKSFDKSNNFIESNTLQDFILGSRPYCVLDAIEIFILEKYNYKFISHINSILDRTGSNCHYRIKQGVFSLGKFKASLPVKLDPIEKGVKELLEEAISKHNSGKTQDAVEKLWDSLERIKTVLNPVNKKQSADLLIKKMAHDDLNFYSLYNDEIQLLTKIGNSFRIRHHELDKNEIKNILDWEYLYNRCLSFLELAIKFIN